MLTSEIPILLFLNLFKGSDWRYCHFFDSYSTPPEDGAIHHCSGGTQPENNSVSKAKGRVGRGETRLVAPPSSYLSLSDWKGCTVTRCETITDEYEHGREDGDGTDSFLDLRGLHASFLFAPFCMNECLLCGIFIFSGMETAMEQLITPPTPTPPTSYLHIMFST